MTFPNYYLYLQATAERNLLYLILAVYVLMGLLLIELARRVRPDWQQAAAWLIGVGGFYATLAALYLSNIARAPVY